MKRNLFSPILDYFEKGDEPYAYKKSHRTILKLVGMLFLLLSFVSLYLMLNTGEYGAVLPLAFFFAAGFVSLLIGFAGSDRAVAKIWGSRPGR